MLIVKTEENVKMVNVYAQMDIKVLNVNTQILVQRKYAKMAHGASKLSVEVTTFIEVDVFVRQVG